MSVYIIPLQGLAETFEISLAGVLYKMAVKWNDSPVDGGWQLDIANGETDELIVGSIALVTGANLLENLDYLEFGGSLVVFTDGDKTAVPTFENLGTESNLYFVTEDE